jgi:hypothetical protein
MNQCSRHHMTVVIPIVSMSLLQYIVLPHEHCYNHSHKCWRSGVAIKANSS